MPFFLSTAQDARFRSAVNAVVSTNEIFKITRALQVEMAHDEALTKFCETLQRNKLHLLMANEAYRAYLNSDKAHLWAQPDELAFATNLVEKKMARCAVHCTMWTEVSGLQCSEARDGFGASSRNTISESILVDRSANSTARWSIIKPSSKEARVTADTTSSPFANYTSTTGPEISQRTALCVSYPSRGVFGQSSVRVTGSAATSNTTNNGFPAAATP